jgi:nitrite reductase/ring-hydroxylating ferredoxin subunit
MTDDEIKRVELPDGRAFAIYRLDDSFFVTDDLCTHGDAMLSEGMIEDGQVICPYHQGAFDIRTGEATGAPCSLPIRTYSVHVVDGEIQIDA